MPSLQCGSIGGLGSAVKHGGSALVWITLSEKRFSPSNVLKLPMTPHLGQATLQESIPLGSLCLHTLTYLQSPY